MERESILYKTRRKCQVLASYILPDKTLCKIYTKAVLKKINLDSPVTFNEKIQWLKISDYAMWLKVIYKVDCYLLNDNLAKYRIRSGFISRNSKIKLIKYYYKLYRDGDYKSVISSCILTL